MRRGEEEEGMRRFEEGREEGWFFAIRVLEITAGEEEERRSVDEENKEEENKGEEERGRG